MPSIMTPCAQPLRERAPEQNLCCALMQSAVVPGMQFGLMLCGRTVAPEVVNLDIDSNHELTNL